MTIPVVCSCGKAFTLKDEAAGRVLLCSGCGQPITVPSEPPTACPGCGKSLAAGAVVCVGCGYDMRTGVKHAAGRLRRAKERPSRIPPASGPSVHAVRGVLLATMLLIVGGIGATGLFWVYGLLHPVEPVDVAVAVQPPPVDPVNEPRNRVRDAATLAADGKPVPEGIATTDLTALLKESPESSPERVGAAILLAGRGAEVRSELLLILGQLPTTLPDQRTRLLAALHRAFPPAELAGPTLELIRSTKPETTDHPLLALLVEVGGRDLPAVVKLIEDATLPVGTRREVARLLGRMTPPSETAIPALTKWLTGMEADLAGAAAESLARLGVDDEPVVARLRTATGEKSSAGERALAALGALAAKVPAARPKVLPVILNAAEVSPDAAQAAALDADPDGTESAALHRERFLHRLAALRAKPDDADAAALLTRTAAVIARDLHKAAPALQELRAALKQPMPPLGLLKAAAALGMTAELQRLAETSPDAAVKAAAAAALAESNQ